MCQRAGERPFKFLPFYYPSTNLSRFHLNYGEKLCPDSQSHYWRARFSLSVSSRRMASRLSCLSSLSKEVIALLNE